MDPVRLAGVTLAFRVTLPVNPLRLVKLTVEVPDEPTAMLSDVGLAPIPKSTMVRPTLTERVTVPLLPLTVRVKLPRLDAPAATVSCDWPIPPGEITTKPGVIVAVGTAPVVAEVAVTLVENVTLPVNRLYVLTVMAEFTDWPASILRLVGFALRW